MLLWPWNRRHGPACMLLLVGCLPLTATSAQGHKEDRGATARKAYADEAERLFPLDFDKVKATTMKHNSRKLIGALLSQDRIVRSTCNWNPSPLREPFQDFVRVLRSVSRYSFGGGGTSLADCVEAIAPGSVDETVERVMTTFGNVIDGTSFTPISTGEPFGPCEESSECFNNKAPYYCGVNKENETKTCQPCIRCLDQEFELDDPPDAVDPQKRPVAGEQCFNVCPEGITNKVSSCIMANTRLFNTILNFVTGKICGGLAEDKMDFLLSEGGGKLGTAGRVVSNTLFTNITGLPLKSWAKIVAWFFKVFKTGVVQPIRLFLEYIGKKIKWVEGIAKFLKSFEGLLNRPLTWSRNLDRKAEDACLIPCPQDFKSPKLSDVDWIPFDLKTSPPQNGISSPRPTQCNPKLKACNPKLSVCPGGQSLTAKSNSPGWIRHVGRKAKQFNRYLSDYFLYTEVFYLFFVSPVEDLLCTMSNTFPEMVSTVHDHYQQSGSGRRATSCTSFDIDDVLNSDEVKTIAKSSLAAASGIAQAVAGIQKQSEDILKIFAPYPPEQGKPRAFDAMYLPLVAALVFVQETISLLEKVATAIMVPLLPLFSGLSVLGTLVDKVNGFLPDFGLADFIMDALINPFLDALNLPCGSLSDCIVEMIVSGIPGCKCIDDEDCVAKGYSAEDNCLNFLVPNIGVDFDVDLGLEFTNIVDASFDLPQFDIALEEFQVNLIDGFRGLDADLFKLSNPFSGLFESLKNIFNTDCIPEDAVEFKYKSVFTDLTDGATLKLDGCADGSRVIIRQATFRWGSNCYQDLSARLRYPMTLVADGQQGSDDGQVTLSFSLCESNCDLSNVGQYLDQVCRDESVREDPIDLSYGDPSHDDLPPLGWIPENSILRDYMTKGRFEATYLCWGFQGDPPFVGELQSDPEGARPSNNPRFRDTDVDATQKYILKSGSRFVPTTYEALCVDDDYDNGSGQFTGPWRRNDDKVEPRSFDSDTDPTNMCRKNDGWCTHPQDGSSSGPQPCNAVSRSLKSNNGNCEFDISIGMYINGDTWCRSSRACRDTSENAPVIVDQQSWPGNAFVFGPGSNLGSELDERLWPSMNNLKFCVSRDSLFCNKWDGPDKDVCHSIQDGDEDFRINEFLWSLLRHYPDTTFDSKIDTFKDDGSKLNHIVGMQTGNYDTWNFQGLGSLQNLLKKRRYRSPTNGQLQCIDTRQLHLETIEYEPCIDEDGRSKLWEGYCTFRDQFGGRTEDGKCVGTRACPSECLDGTKVRSWDCNCRDNNCVKLGDKVSYLHRGFPSQYDSFEDYLRSDEFDLGKAFENWSACSFWVAISQMGMRNTEYTARTHRSRQHECVQGQCSGSEPSDRLKFDTYEQCVAYQRLGRDTQCIADTNDQAAANDIYGFTPEFGSNRMNPPAGMCLVDKKCERVFDPKLDDDKCPFSSAKRVDARFKAATLVEEYESERLSLFNQCDSRIREACSGQTQCNYLDACSSLDSSKPEIGLLQWACARPPGSFEGFNRLEIQWADSRNNIPGTISCLKSDGFIRIAGQAIFGAPFAQQDGTADFFARLCTDDSSGISCTVDVRQMATIVGDPDPTGKALRVDYSCICGSGYHALPDPMTNACIECPPNLVRDAEAGDRACRPCLPGTYRTGPSTCSPTPAGTYSDVFGSTDFIACPVGTYSTVPGMTKQSDCLCPPDNFVTRLKGDTPGASVGYNNETELCPAGSERIQEENTVVETDVGSTEVIRRGALIACQAVCTACAPGFVRAADSLDGCVPCPAGSIPNPHSSACDPCPVGTYSPPGVVACLRCPYGCYSDQESATQCQKCELMRPGFTTPWPLIERSDPSLTEEGVYGCVEPVESKGENPAYPLGLTCIELINLANEAKNGTLLYAYGTNESAGRVEPINAAQYEEDQWGNGVCNGWPLNSEECGFDGGDCCETTCVKATADLTFGKFVLDETFALNETGDDLRSFLLEVPESVMNDVAASLNAKLNLLNKESILEGNVFVADLSKSIIREASTEANITDGTVAAEEGFLNISEATAAFPFDVTEGTLLFDAGDTDRNGYIDAMELTGLLGDILELLLNYNAFIDLDSTCGFQQFQCIQTALPPCSPAQPEVVQTDPDPDACKELLNGMTPSASTLPGWGDGLCDPSLNHASCGYDGGDCCQKTCVYNRCSRGSCSKSSTSNCRDPGVNEPAKRPPPELVTAAGTEPVDIDQSCSAVAKPLGVFLVDVAGCSGSSLEHEQARTEDPSGCPSKYSLYRTWNAAVRGENGTVLASAEELSQTITVFDDDAPEDMRDGEVVLCLWPPNKKWVVIQGASRAMANSIDNDSNANFNVPPTEVPLANADGDPFGLQRMLYAHFVNSTFRWEFYDCAPVRGVTMVGCTASDEGGTEPSDGCLYDETTDTLYLRSKRKSGRAENIYTISALVGDGECGNDRVVSRKVVVPRNGECGETKHWSPSVKTKDLPDGAVMFGPSTTNGRYLRYGNED